VDDVIVFVESNTTGTGRLFAERARALGLVPHLLTADVTRYPYVTELDIPAHQCATGSLQDVLDGCGRLAARHPVAGITSSSEYFIATAAAAARALGLPAEDPARLAAARDKGIQRRCFASCGVDSPGFRLASSASEAVGAAHELGLPVILKPVSRSGSLGVRRCDTTANVAAHAAALLATATDERGSPLPASFLVESYLPGPEFSVEILGGSVRAVVAKHVDESIGFLETGHDVPADIDAGTESLLAASARAAVAALGLTWGAAHVEFRVTGDRAYVVEVNPRLAGGMIPQAVLAATGQDLISELIARTAGHHVRAGGPSPARCGRASIRFLVPVADGEVRSVPDASVALASPGVVEAAVTARPGQAIVRQGCFLDRLGYVIAVGSTQEEASERAERAAAALAVEITAPAPGRSTHGGP
jgi:argininosuccinate lyase